LNAVTWFEARHKKQPSTSAEQRVKPKILQMCWVLYRPARSRLRVVTSYLFWGQISPFGAPIREKNLGISRIPVQEVRSWPPNFY
jgi:hypothetical protein